MVYDGIHKYSTVQTVPVIYIYVVYYTICTLGDI